MAINLAYPTELTELAEKTAAFIREVVVPEEERYGGVILEDGEVLRTRLQDAARAAGVFAPQVPQEYGGRHLDMTHRARIFEEAGWSLFGPLALNIAAPDEATLHLLEVVATPVQKDRYLGPVALGHSRSCFAMTEPAPGAGSDPRALATAAVKVSGGWRIDGRKWFITGADGADYAICMARTSGVPGDKGGATMFIVEASNPGMQVLRHVGTIDQSFLGGHCEVVFDGCVVPDSAILGEVGEGFRYAQVRLGPGRVTHCMRWLGLARRAQDIALAYANSREAFGRSLGQLGLAQGLLADSEIDIAASRALTLQACWDIDTDGPWSTSTSIAKTFTAEAVWRVVDRAVQVCGGLGVSDDILLSRFLREVRPFRIYDGPSEVHRWSIARGALRRVAQASAESAREGL
jgi:acyl-CoA dehydrogenase